MKPDADFRGAVSLAKNFLRPLLRDQQLSLPDVEPSEVLLWFALPCLHVEDDLGVFYVYPDGAAEWLYGQASHSRGAFDLLCRIVAAKVMRGEELSPPLREFAALRIGPGLPPPAAYSKISSTFVANLYLVILAYGISRRFGLSLTRNEASEPTSACDAVSHALLELGHAKSWRAIKELILNKINKKLNAGIESLKASYAELGRTNPWVQDFFASFSAWRRDGDGD